MPFEDLSAEMAVNAGILRHGRDAFVDCEYLLDASKFSLEFNQLIYSVAQDHFGSGADRKLDYPTLLSVAKRKGFGAALETHEAQRHVKSLMNYPVELASVHPEAAKLLKLDIGRRLDEKLADARKGLRKITGDESLNEILAMVEDPVFEFTSKLNGGDNDTKQIGEGAEEWLENVLGNPRDNIGVPTPYPKFNKLIGGGFRRRGISIVGARPKAGKALPLDNTVITPTGPKKMGDIRVGDKVCNADGSTSIVQSVHPQGVRDVYRVIFADGDSVECDLEHLWKVKPRRKKEFSVVPLSTLVDNLYEMDRSSVKGYRPKWQVPLPQPCYYEARPVPLDPYLLGYLIGNGGLTRGSIRCTIPDKETLNRLSAILDDEYSLKPVTGRPEEDDYVLTHGRHSRRNAYIEALRTIGLMGSGSHGKFIPHEYKYNSSEIRWAIFQGWMDADGTATPNTQGNGSSQLEGSTVSQVLAEDIKELVQSLGGLCRCVPRTTTCNGKEFPSYRLHIRFNDATQCFRLTRKKQRSKVRRKPSLKRAIAGVEFVGSKLVQCIKLDSEDGLFLTDHHVVTHNTTLVDNIALHVAGTLGIPVFNLDTEMTDEEHWARILGHLTGIPIELIESGHVTAGQARALREKAKWLKSIPYYYRSVIDESFDEQVAAMRRWVVKDVGTDDEGVRKDCLIIYDYLQLTDPGEFAGNNFKEYQLLGFQMVALSRMAKRYDVPIFSLLQLNRDGIDKESTAVAAGSDRIIWKCSNFSILKRKEPEEIQADGGPANGNAKLISLIARHGPGGEAGDYINLHFDLATAKITEGKTKFELEKGKKQSTHKGFEKVDEPGEETDPPW